MPTSCQRCPGHAWIFFRSHFLPGSQVFLSQFAKCRNGLHGIHSRSMPESISLTYSCFFERIAERITRALEQRSNRRTKDQAAREKELALWTEVFEAVVQYCKAEHALTSRLTAEPSHTNRGCDSMGMGERARTPDFRSCDYRKHDDRETPESEGTMLEAALSGLQVPPGLERGNRIPNHLWKNLPDKWQEEVRAAGKRRRQLARRARNKDVAHPDLRWQSRQHGDFAGHRLHRCRNHVRRLQ